MTFYDTIIRSKEWGAWEQEQIKRMSKDEWIGTFDYIESLETGLMSKEHWDSFIEFVKSDRF